MASTCKCGAAQKRCCYPNCVTGAATYNPSLRWDGTNGTWVRGALPWHVRLAQWWKRRKG